MRERLVNTPDEVERLFRILREARTVTYDTETSGLDWKRCHPIGYVITPLGEDSMYVPVRHAGGGNLPGCRVPMTAEGWKGDLHPFEIEFGKITAETPRLWIGQNLIFDLRFSHRAGIELYGDFEDTSVNGPLIDEYARFSLDALAKAYGVQSKKGEDLYQYLSEQFGCPADKKSMANFWRTDASVPIVWQYAAGDGVSTEEVWTKQQPDLDADGLRRVQKVENRLIRTLYRMTRGGVVINEQELHAVDKWYASEAEKAKINFPPGFKPNAPSQLAEMLKHHIDKGSWPRGEITPTAIKRAAKTGEAAMGALKFDKATLELVPEGRAIIDAKQLDNAQSLYTKPMIERHLWQGRVHCEFYQMANDEYGTISGRLSCADPNLQAVTKRNKRIGKPYRAIFKPEPGAIWIDRDYKQQEYVVFTDYTGDPMLMAGYAANPPVDIHQTVAEMMSVERDPTAKRMNLGILYGMSIPTLAGHLGCSQSQAKIWMDRYHSKFTSARPFLKGATDRARQRGYIHTYLGRRRRFPGGQNAHKAGNAVIQGSSADITKLKMVEIDEYFASEGDYCRLMLQIHDSLSWSQPDDEQGRRMTAEADRIMVNFAEGQPIKMRARLLTDFSEGPNWGVATFG